MHRLLLPALVLISTALAARLPDLIPYRNGDKWGYCDSTKKLVIDTVYQSAEFFHSGRAITKKNNKFGVIDANGKQVIPFIYKSLESVFISGYWSACLLGDKKGVIDSTGKFVIPAAYEEIWWSGGKFLSGRNGEDWTILSVEGKELYKYHQTGYPTPAEYVASTGDFIVHMEDGFGVLNRKMKWKIEPKYSSIRHTADGFYRCQRGDFFDVRPDSKRLFRRKRKPTPDYSDYAVPAYTPTYYPHGHSETTDTTGKWGWKSYETEKWLVMPKYDSTGFFQYGMAIFVVDGKMGIVNEKFQEVIEPKYHRLIPVAEGLAMVMKPVRAQISFHLDLRLFMGYVDVHGTEYWEN